MRYDSISSDQSRTIWNGVLIRVSARPTARLNTTNRTHQRSARASGSWIGVACHESSPAALELRNAATASRAVTGEPRQDDHADRADSDAYFGTDPNLLFGSGLVDGSGDEATPGPGACTDKRNARIVVMAPDRPGTRKGRAGTRPDQRTRDHWMPHDPMWLSLRSGCRTLCQFAPRRAERPRATGLHVRLGPRFRRRR